MIHRSEAFTLIETVIAMAISVFLLLAVIAILVSVKQSYLTQLAYARIQENGRFLHYFLTQIAEQAGRDCDGQLASLPFVKALPSGFAIKTCYSFKQHARYDWIHYEFDRNTFYEKYIRSKRRAVLSDISAEISYGIACEDQQNICQYRRADAIQTGQRIRALQLKVTLTSNKTINVIWPIYLFVGGE